MENTKAYNMLKNTLNLDDTDIKIILLLQDNSEISFTEIAKKLQRSQPAIGIRVKKLIDRGILKKIYGINFKNTEFTLAFVSISHMVNTEYLKKINDSACKVLAWTMSGNHNLNMLICGNNIQQIANTINTLSKDGKHAYPIKFEIITTLLSDFVLPIKND